MSKKIVIANWKMNPASSKEVEKFFSGILKNLPSLKDTTVIVCPPCVFLDKLSKIKTTKIKLGAQNVFYEDRGAYTGEVSGAMLQNFGVRYVILGHSERRSLGEKNEDVNKKIKASLSCGLLPILCVGECTRDENHKYLNFIKTQIEECLSGIQKNLLSKIIIAYEPIWAIGKNAIREATGAEFLEMKIFIKKTLNDISNGKTEIPKIIYGGSVDDKNILDFINNGQADGFLVGRASLDAEKFSKIVKICETSKV